MDITAAMIRTIERRRDRLFQRVLSPLVDTVVEGSSLDHLVRGVQQALGNCNVSSDALFESTRYLAGNRLTLGEARRLAWRLAGNVSRLEDGQPVVAWSMQLEDEWVPLEAMRLAWEKTDRGKIRAEVTFRALGGTPCPSIVRAYWSHRGISVVARSLGFSGFRGKFRFSRAEQLVGLRLAGRVEPQRSRNCPIFRELQCHKSLQKWNRDRVLRLRLRIGEDCPQAWRHHCHQCAVGYEECRAGTHRKTYQQGTCGRCGDEDVFFDPDDTDPRFCLRCNRKLRMKGST